MALALICVASAGEEVAGNEMFGGCMSTCHAVVCEQSKKEQRNMMQIGYALDVFK